jgi:hypothetical protein
MLASSTMRTDVPDRHGGRETLHLVEVDPPIATPKGLRRDSA